MSREFIMCSVCNKPIISYDRDKKVLYFRFGKDITREESMTPVNMEITLPVEGFKMQCFRRDCRKNHPDHWNLIDINLLTKQFKKEEV